MTERPLSELIDMYSNEPSATVASWSAKARALESDLERLRKLLYTFFYTQDDKEYQRVELELIEEARKE